MSDLTSGAAAIVQLCRCKLYSVNIALDTIWENSEDLLYTSCQVIKTKLTKTTFWVCAVEQDTSLKTYERKSEGETWGYILKETTAVESQPLYTTSQSKSQQQAPFPRRAPQPVAF